MGATTASILVIDPAIIRSMDTIGRILTGATSVLMPDTAGRRIASVITAMAMARHSGAISERTGHPLTRTHIPPGRPSR